MRACADALLERVDGVTWRRLPTVERQADVAHAVAAVDGVPEVRGAGSAGVDRNGLATAFDGVERSLHPLLDLDVAGDDRDRVDVDARRAQREQEGDRVVGCGVGVDQEAHRVTIATTGSSRRG